MKRFTDAGRKAISDQNLYAALSLALMIPDICGSLEQPGPGRSQKRYESWFLKWAQPKFTGDDGHVYLSAADCYQLRCSLIHSGSAEIEVSKRDVLDQIEFFDDTAPVHLGWFEGNIINGITQPNVLALRASNFSETMYQCAEEWDAATANDTAIRREKRKLLTIRSSGHTMQGVQLGEASVLKRIAQEYRYGDVSRRRDDALRRALSTPPKPKQESAERKERKARKGKPAE